MSSPDPGGTSPRALAEITPELQATLAELLVAARDCGSPADLWIIVSTCERTLVALASIVDPLADWLTAHGDTVATHGQGSDHLRRSVQRTSTQLRELGRSCHRLATGLSRLG